MNTISFDIFSSTLAKFIPLLRKQHASWMILWYILQHNFHVSFYEQRSLRAGKNIVLFVL